MKTMRQNELILQNNLKGLSPAEFDKAVAKIFGMIFIVDETQAEEPKKELPEPKGKVIDV
jgi:hypothetical protein